MLSTLVDSYLELRRASGFQLEEREKWLRDFARFAEARGEHHVCSQSVLDWTRERGGTPSERDKKLGCLCLFAHFARAEDPRHEVPSRHAFGRVSYRRRPPFPFTLEDVRGLVRLAGREVGPPGSLQPHAYSTLLGLLACTGLRISEALHLTFADVTEDGLVIRNTKFGKSRLVPLHPTARTKLEEYLTRRTQEAGGCDHVFVSARGTPLSAQSVRAVFRRLISRLGLVPKQGGRRPRPHDLRHYFATRVLVSAPLEGGGGSQHLLALSTYLGHADFRNTYWYLEASPELLTRIANDRARYLEGERA